MRSCDEILELISAALDGALSAEEQAVLDEHLSRCPACAALFAELASLHEAAGSLEEIPAPADFADRVMEQIDAGPEQERPANVTPFPAKKRTRWKGWAAAAVVAVAALGAVALPGLHGADGQTQETLLHHRSSIRPSDENLAPQAAGEDESVDVAPVTGEPSAGDNQLPGAPFPDEARAACGVLTLTGETLPDGLEEYESIAGSDGTVTYVVPADYFFSCLDQLEGQSFEVSLSAEEDAAGYGLIIVEVP